MVVILFPPLPSSLPPPPLQPHSNTKIIPDKKATLMTGGFLLADSMLEVY